MFLGLEWESRKLLQQQCLIADRIGLKYSVLPEQLTTTVREDTVLYNVDTISDCIPTQTQAGI